MEKIIKDDVSEIIKSNPDLMEEIDGKSFLVTGSTGMIGSYVVCLLAENSLQNNNSGSILAHARNRQKGEKMFAEYLEMPNFQLLVSDVNDMPEIDYGLDYILHAASPTQPQDFLERPVDIINANVLATKNLLELSRGKMAKFCLLSTLEVYGEIQAESYPVYVHEEDYGSMDSLSLRSAYPESKRLAENMCVSYRKQYGVDSTIVRIAPVISPVIALDDKRVFAQLLNDATSGKDLSIYSDAASKERSYTYVADSISGILTALVRSSKDNYVFNLANNENVVSIQGLAKAIIDSCESHQPSLTIVDRDPDNNTCSNTGLVLLNSEKLIKLGWKPRYTLKDSIKKAILHKTQEV